LVLPVFGVQTGEGVQDMRIVVGQLRRFDGGGDVGIVHLAGEEGEPRNLVENLRVLLALIDQFASQCDGDCIVGAGGIR